MMKIKHGYLGFPLVRSFGYFAQPVSLGNLQLGSILDADDFLVILDKSGQGVEQGGFT